MGGDGSNSDGRRMFRLDPCWPVLPGPRYRGLVWNHDTVRDGTLITTSAVVELKDGRLVTRSGSAYQLGRIFSSEQEALEQAAQHLRADASPAPPELRVIDLESDDPSLLDTFAHERLLDTAS